MRLPSRRVLIVLGSLHALAGVAGVAASLVLTRELPGISDLDLLRLPQMTVLLDRRGGRVSSFAEQRRTPVTLDQIAPNFINALLATEDPRFYKHIGIDLKAITRALWVNIVSLHWGVQGGSTITQQLARDQFLYPRKTITRKLQEMILALAIEKQYTKREILELYCNRIYLGHGRYGVQAAAEFYFGKKARDLTLPEAALLAGLPQRPEGYSPIKWPERARARRNHVLQRMLGENFGDRNAIKAALNAPLGVVKSAGRGAAALYYSEEVRRILIKQFGEDAVYRSGLVVRTNLDPVLQRAAEQAVRTGLDQYGRRRRMVPAGRRLGEGESPADFVDPSWGGPFAAGDIVPALVTSVALNKAEVRVGDDSFTLTEDDIAWTGRRVFQGLLAPGRLFLVKIREVDSGGKPTALELAADPPVEAAFLAIDPADGAVLALVGGRDFENSEFDRAMQAQRQAGSAFKPFIYAAALEKGFTPSQRVWDVPTVLLDPGAPAPYQPENYDADYQGLVTLQHALEHSRNIPTVRLLDAIGYEPAVQLGRRLGIRADLKPYPSLALGAFEVRLVDLVAAFGSFVNGGVLMTPQLIRSVQSADGQDLWTATPDAQEVLAPEVAATIVAMLEGTTSRGTAAAAQGLGRPTMGKTGTTNDFTDAWFIGCTPSLAAGAWIGFDQRRPLGRGETGAQAALPMWMRFIEQGLAGSPPEDFPRPPGVVQILIDLDTGLRARPEAGCQRMVLETFPSDQNPPGWCSPRDHIRLSLPYPLQPFPLRRDGALMIPPVEAARVAALAPDKFQVLGGKQMRYRWGDTTGVAALAWSSADWARYLQDLSRATAAVAAGLPPAEAGPPRHGASKGVDGWPAETLEVNRTGGDRPIDIPIDP